MCVLDPELVRSEARLTGDGPSSAAILIDSGARIVLPAHKLIDAGREGASGSDAYGTTKTGMGPAHEDLFGRKGLTVSDMAKGPNAVRTRLTERRYYEEKQALAAFWGICLPSLDETVLWCSQFTEMFRRYEADTRDRIGDLRRKDLPILWEGAHGAMIDVINGTMPTSSLVSPWSAVHCYGPMRPGMSVIGTFRPYVTRTGPGPMPTEMTDADAARLHDEAGEIESTSGRKQRCGWLDLPAVSATARLTGTTHLYLTKMDVTPFEKILVCVGYQADRLAGSWGSRHLSSELLQNAAPIYEELDGWEGHAVARARSWNELPRETVRFIEFVESHLKRPVIAVGNGPARGQTISTSHGERRA